MRAGTIALMVALGAIGASSARAEGEATMHVRFTCNHVTFLFENFPNAENNTVYEAVYIDGVRVVKANKFQFNGPTGSNTVIVHVPPGHHKVDARARWETNGVRGAKDITKFGGITCDPEPSYTIEKDQKLEGTTGYSPETLGSTHVGQTIEYAIEVANTGNVPLTLSNLADTKCEEITGGYSEIGINHVTTFFCHHKLNAADAEAGEHCNSATVTAPPPEGDGPPVTEESNAVCAELPRAKFSQQFSCIQVTFKFTGFPNLAGNTVHEAIYADGKKIYKGEFKFDGSSGENTVVINLSPGKHRHIDVRARWKTNGVRGGEDHALGSAKCVAERSFTIEKLQRIQSEAEYTTGPLSGEAGQTVEYEVLIKNTGNVALFNSGGDSGCGQSWENAEDPVGGTLTFLCSYELTEDDELAGIHSNTATNTTTSEGPPVTHESNTVEVEVD
jgi:hypothetical protein